MILLPRSAGYIGTWLSLMTTLVAAAGVMVVALFCFFQRQRRTLYSDNHQACARDDYPFLHFATSYLCWIPLFQSLTSTSPAVANTEPFCRARSAELSLDAALSARRFCSSPQIRHSGLSAFTLASGTSHPFYMLVRVDPLFLTSIGSLTNDKRHLGTAARPTASSKRHRAHLSCLSGQCTESRPTQWSRACRRLSRPMFLASIFLAVDFAQESSTQVLCYHIGRNPNVSDSGHPKHSSMPLGAIPLMFCYPSTIYRIDDRLRTPNSGSQSSPRANPKKTGLQWGTLPAARAGRVVLNNGTHLNTSKSLNICIQHGQKTNSPM